MSEDGPHNSASSADPTSSLVPMLPPVMLGSSSSASLIPPSFSLTAPTPEPSPSSYHRKAQTDPQTSILRPPATSSVGRRLSSSKGKRKAEEFGVDSGSASLKDSQIRATFVIEPRPHRASANSSSTHAPSSYQRKRARLSVTPDVSSSTASDGLSKSRPQNSRTTGSWSSRVSRTSSRTESNRASPAVHLSPQEISSRRSLSQASIPVSALISPHAPSVIASSTYHMRDPRKPLPIRSTTWALSLATGKWQRNEGWREWVGRGGSPLHAWLFFLGFLIFPVWWVASFIKIPRTRLLGVIEREKGVLLDDPQLEYDARSWRKRCRIMTFVSFFSYIPFIILVAFFVS